MNPKSRIFMVSAVTAAWLCAAVELAGQSGGSTPLTAGSSSGLIAGGPTMPKAVGSAPLTSGNSTMPKAVGSVPLTAGGYDAGGRRDPFVSLIVPKTTTVVSRPANASRPGAGLAGISVSDVQLKGVIRSGANFVAILQGPDGRTFLAKRLDKLMDGVIKGIESNAVVFTERVEDAAGAVRQRDVRKALRTVVAGGQS